MAGKIIKELEDIISIEKHKITSVSIYGILQEYLSKTSLAKVKYLKEAVKESLEKQVEDGQVIETIHGILKLDGFRLEQNKAMRQLRMACEAYGAKKMRKIVKDVAKWDTFSSLYSKLPWDSVLCAGGYALLNMVSLEEPRWKTSDIDLWVYASAIEVVRKIVAAWYKENTTEGTFSAKIFPSLMKFEGYNAEAGLILQTDLIVIPDGIPPDMILEMFDIPVCRVGYKYAGDNMLEMMFSPTILDREVEVCALCEIFNTEKIRKRTEERIEKYKQREFYGLYRSYIVCKSCFKMLSLSTPSFASAPTKKGEVARLTTRRLRDLRTHTEPALRNKVMRNATEVIDRDEIAHLPKEEREALQARLDEIFQEYQEIAAGARQEFDVNAGPADAAHAERIARAKAEYREKIRELKVRPLQDDDESDDEDITPEDVAARGRSLVDYKYMQ